MGAVKEVVLLMDGAAGLEHMGRDCFKGCESIVDFYHTMEHAALVLAALIGKPHPDYMKRLRRWAKRMLKDKVHNLSEEVLLESVGLAQSATVEQELGYFIRNVERMQYGTFRAKGYFIGSGVVEAGCKAVIGARCKQSGMHWSNPGAQNVLALRCIHQSHRLEEFWKYRLNSLASLNDPLPISG
jgi:hypothetical protein